MTGTLGPRDVLVLDEAGMVGSRQMDRVFAAVRAAGAKLVLVGDHEQLQAIEAGAAFRAIVERVGAAEITEVRRQQVAWQREATRELATGRTGEALARYQAAGMVRTHATDEAAMTALITGWQAARERAPEERQIILAHTRDDVRALNDAARALRREAGELGEDRVLPTGLGPRSFAVGDQVYFLRNERGLGGVGVKNGTLGTIVAIAGDGEGARLSVRLGLDESAGGSSKTVSFALAEYADLDHGYAATTHKAQSVTVDRTHVLATPGMDRHLAYVALTRHRHEVALHWSEEAFGSPARFAARLSRERAKDTTLDYGESEAELSAAYAERRGLHRLAPESEVVVCDMAPRPGTARRKLRRLQLQRAVQPVLCALRDLVDEQKTVLTAIAMLAKSGLPTPERRRPRDHVVQIEPEALVPQPAALDSGPMWTALSPMLEEAVAQSTRETPPPRIEALPTLRGSPYKPVARDEIDAAIAAAPQVGALRRGLAAERKAFLPSRFNGDHKRFYTPKSLLAEIETSLPVGCWRLRSLRDIDEGFIYALPPDQHPRGSYEIGLVVEKTEAPTYAARLSPSPHAKASIRFFSSLISIGVTAMLEGRVNEVSEIQELLSSLPLPGFRSLDDSFIELFDHNDVVRFLRPVITKLQFDESDYLGRYADVRLAVKAGRLSSGREHYVRDGYFRGRQAEPIPSIFK